MTVQEEVSTGPVSWGSADVPDLAERTMIVTGASSGLGLVLTRHLAGHGATVLMAVRDLEKGERVREELVSTNPDGAFEVWPLDLLDLDSVRRFADGIREDGRPIDALVNNGGISNRPRRLSPQGYESQFATNHLGHFALTGLLLERLERGNDPRVVTVASGFYRRVRGGLNFDDLQGEKRYSPVGAYARSKLANVLFGAELERRLRAAESPVRSLVAHPGVAATPLSRSANSTAERLLATIVVSLLARPAEQGTLPLLFAAIDPRATAGGVHRAERTQAAHKDHPGRLRGPRNGRPGSRPPVGRLGGPHRCAVPGHLSQGRVAAGHSPGDGTSAVARGVGEELWMQSLLRLR